MNTKAMKYERPNYFSGSSSVEDAAIRRIKGNFRREMVFKKTLAEGWASVPEDWKAHDIPEELKNELASQAGPQARGGEDLPNLADGEVEIARLSLVNSVHGEVTSLRATQDPEDSSIWLDMVDEYDTDFVLPIFGVPAPLTAREVLQMFRDAEPTPTDTSCEIRFTSFFYPDLDHLAIEIGIKSNDCVTSSAEPEIERKTEAAVGKSATQQAFDGSQNGVVAKKQTKAVKQSPSNGTDAPVSSPTAKNYKLAIIGIIAFFIGLSLTKAGSVLLHGDVAAKDLVARATVSSFMDMISWIFWAATGSYLFVSFGSVFLFLRVFKWKKWGEAPSRWLFLIRLFVIPFATLLWLAVVLGVLASVFITGKMGCVLFPFGVMAKAAAIAFGLYILFAGLGMSSFSFWQYSGFGLAVMGTILMAQLQIPEKLLGKGSLSATSLYPGILTISICWAFAWIVSWLGATVTKRIFAEHESRRTLFGEAIGTIGGFMSLCFLLEYSRMAGA